MAIIRQRKKNLILSMILGMVLVAVPLGIYGGIITHREKSVEKELKQLKKQVDAEKVYTAYCFKEKKGKGELIREEDLQKIFVKTRQKFIVPTISDLKGKYTSVDTEAGVIITNSAIYEDIGLQDDVRMYLYDFIVLPQGLGKEDLFDIRIRFPNGEDYVVAVGKKVESVVEQGAFINATEEENLLLSSAYVDTTVYEGTKIYASLYVEDYQKTAVANYPFNLYTTELAEWDPNLIERMETKKNQNNRQVLEQNLYDFMGVSMGGETLINT